MRFVQITACGHANTMNTQSDWTVFGLDADGQVWMQDSTHSGWVPLEMEPIKDDRK